MPQTPPLAALTQPVISEPIDLYTLDISVLLPAGSTDQSIYRFCNWTTTNGQDVVYQGLTYTAIPLEAQGFEVGGSQQLARPTLTIANVGLAITGLINTYGDLVGATVTRIRTLTTYLDGGATPDSTAYFGPDVFVIEQRSREDKLVTQWQLAAPFDLEGMTLPSRKLLREQCQWIYKSGTGCTHIPKPSSSGTFTTPAVTGTYTSDGNTITAIGTNSYQFGSQVSLTINSGGAPSGTYFITRAGTTGFEATKQNPFGRTGTWAIEVYGTQGSFPFVFNIYKFRLYIANHGLTVGQSIGVTLTFFSPSSFLTGFQDRSVNAFAGNATVLAAGTDDFWIDTTVNFASKNGYFYVGNTAPSSSSSLIPASPQRPASSITPSYSGSFTGPASDLLITSNGHGLTDGLKMGFAFPGTPSANGIYKVFGVTTNTFRILGTQLIANPGSVIWGGYFDENDTPVTSADHDVCGKRLTSCQLRFGSKGYLPFGGFPGLVDKMG